MKNVFKTLKTLHLALGIAMIAFAFVALFVQKKGIATDKDEFLERILQVVCVIVSVASLLIGFNLFKRRMIAARNSPEPGEKRMALYLTACVTWWAMIEGPGLLAIVAYFLTGNLAFMALAIFHITTLIAFMPRKQNI